MEWPYVAGHAADVVVHLDRARLMGRKCRGDSPEYTLAFGPTVFVVRAFT